MIQAVLRVLDALPPLVGRSASCFTVRALARTATLAAALAVSGAWAQQNACGSLDNAYGPFDYRTDRDKLGIVERFHFTPNVEALISGTSGTIETDLDYTLRAFPNHHRALLSILRYAEKVKLAQRLPRPAECYFERAVRFRADDVVARMVYAKFLGSQGRRDEALSQLQQADRDAGENGLSHHNIGLIYLELKDYASARAQAHRAIELGHPAGILRNALLQAGHWADPVSAPSPAASATPP